ncbi:MAG: ergothioneine biosynthesis protein EgtB, partial [Candidatus Kapaibacterium sp.]
MTKHIPLTLQFNQVRTVTESLCKPLDIEDYSTQVDWFASPPKWHLAHTTWFFESFILEKYYKNYSRYDEQFSYLFNSYYFSKGERLTQSERGALSRPTTSKIYEYREYVNRHVAKLLDGPNEAINKLLVLGLNHEQQHQELLLQDIKYNFGSSPLQPIYIEKDFSFIEEIEPQNFIKIDEGVYEIGHDSNLFCFDNEKGLHKQYLHEAEIADRLITNREFKGFINDGGYNN